MTLSQRFAENKHDLEPRQIQIVELMIAGKTNQEIADALGIKLQSVRNNVSRIWPNLDVFDASHAKMLRDQARAEVLP